MNVFTCVRFTDERDTQSQGKCMYSLKKKALILQSVRMGQSIIKSYYNLAPSFVDKRPCEWLAEPHSTRQLSSAKRLQSIASITRLYNGL